MSKAAVQVNSGKARSYGAATANTHALNGDVILSSQTLLLWLSPVGFNVLAHNALVLSRAVVLKAMISPRELVRASIGRRVGSDNEGIHNYY